jgi:H/ACA ribonucleoprotein complex subunit 4
VEGVIVKFDEVSDEKFGKRPEKRDINELLQLGVVIIDKPQGPSSHEVSSWARKILGAKKAGHSGTLDPNVSGVLVVGLNDATKAMGLMLKSSKEYVGIIQFHDKVERKDVEKIFDEFTGDIKQLPPLKSAVKRVVRKRKIYYLAPLEFNGKEVLFKVGCEAGTYIRKLCFDIGKKMRCGANMLELRRTKVGNISEGEAVTLQQISDANWLWKEKGDEKEIMKIISPLEEILDLRKIWLRDSAVESICSGAMLAVPGIAKLEKDIKIGEQIALMTLKDEIVSIGQAKMSSSEIAEKYGDIAANTIRVIMKKGTYPRCW